MSPEGSHSGILSPVIVTLDPKPETLNPRPADLQVGGSGLAALRLKRDLGFTCNSGYLQFYGLHRNYLGGNYHQAVGNWHDMSGLESEASGQVQKPQAIRFKTCPRVVRTRKPSSETAKS